MHKYNQEFDLKSFQHRISAYTSIKIIAQTIADLESLTAVARVETGSHTVAQVVQRLYGVKKHLDVSGLGELTYAQMRKCEELSLSIAVLTVLSEARQLGAKI